MGMEDYRVVLKPKPKTSLFPDDNGLSARMDLGAGITSRQATVAEVMTTLEHLGFARLAPSTLLSGARLADIPQNEARYTLRRSAPSDKNDDRTIEYILEALLQWKTEADGSAAMDRLSVRFAVCQPEEATLHLFRMLKRICDALPLNIVHEGKTYTTDTFWEFCQRANEQIRHQKTLWRNLFMGDTEELPIAVDEAWGYFLAKYQHLQQNPEKTMTPARMQPQTVNAEATMTPNRRKAEVVKRNIQA